MLDIRIGYAIRMIVEEERHACSSIHCLLNSKKNRSKFMFRERLPQRYLELERAELYGGESPVFRTQKFSVCMNLANAWH